MALNFARHIHIDLIDSHFAQKDNLIEASFFKPFTPKAFFELHVMTKEPSQYLKSYAEAGFKRFIGHVEYMKDPQEFISHANHLKTEAYLGIDLVTPVEKVLNFGVKHSNLKGITMMTIHAGESGRPFEAESLEKIKYVKTHFPELTIEADGHMDPETIHSCYKAGATEFAVNSFIFNAPSPLDQYKALVKIRA